jgi:16S rRNA (cytidine1402-2'-O)-methyltransferase
MSGARLFVVATPIGNLEDITLRALRVLREADLIAAEDTRHTGHLLAHFEIRKPVVSLHHFNEARRTAELDASFDAGRTVALVSDAGMPGVSDPGERLIRHCIERDIAVEVIPGPSAVLHALVASGFPVIPFRFVGFLPVKSGQRANAVAAMLASDATTVAFESPHRIQRTLEELARQEPGRGICVARELTKKFEELLRGSAASVCETGRPREWRGEITLVVAPAERVRRRGADEGAAPGEQGGDAAGGD